MNMYITKQGQLNYDLIKESNKSKFNIISNELKELIRKIDCDLNYTNKDKPITLESLAKDVKSQLDEILTFIG